jgi:exosortase/archaeosortase family protein
VLSAIPIAILTNGLRVAATGLGSHHYGEAAVEGVLHDLSGWIIFIVSFVLIVAVARVVRNVDGTRFASKWQVTRA